MNPHPPARNERHGVLATLPRTPPGGAAVRVPAAARWGGAVNTVRPSRSLAYTIARLRRLADFHGRAATGAGDASPRHGLALAGFGVYAGCWALLVRTRGNRDAAPVALPEVLLTGTATFRLTRLLSKAKVTRPLRAPFTDVEEAGAPAEFNEMPKPGHQTVGELLTCPFCLGVWVATGLTAARMVWPRTASAVARTLAAVAVSDALNLGFTALVKAVEEDDPPRLTGGRRALERGLRPRHGRGRPSPCRAAGPGYPQTPFIQNMSVPVGGRQHLHPARSAHSPLVDDGSKSDPKARRRATAQPPTPEASQRHVRPCRRAAGSSVA
ncbi:DUF1360 domain-containing protein [Streptomyces sp. NPDC054883]